MDSPRRRRLAAASLAAAVTLLAPRALAAAPVPAVPDTVRQAGPIGSDWVDATLARLTLRQKVAQMVIAWVEGGTPRYGSAEYDRVRALVVRQQVGGVIVGKGQAVGTAAWLNQLQRWSDVPLLAAADLEWGPGTRLLGATTTPVNMALAATGDLRNVYEAGHITAIEARAAGIHMAFAPVADVNINPRNPVINTRSFGADPATVALNVSTFIAGARDGGLLTVAKHFPGHGDTETDSHLSMPVLAVTRTRLNEVELVPFRAAIRAGVDGIMTAHLSVPALDPLDHRRPATLSPPILTDLLRQELGYGGLVITDALIMDGVRRRASTGEVAVEAVAAGADVLLMPPNAAEAIDAVVAAVRSGRIDEARVDESVRRILRAKQSVGLDRDAQVDIAELGRLLDSEAHRAWADAVAARSLTAVRVAHGALPLDLSGPMPQRVAAVIYDEARSSEAGTRFVERLRDRGARVSVARLSRGAGRSDVAAAERAAADADVVVFLSFSNAAPWRGQLGLPAAVASEADLLAKRGALIFNFGDPYIIGQLPDAETYLLAWSDGEAEERAAARALLGEVAVTGVLPIPLEPGYDLGTGVTLPAIGFDTTTPIATPTAVWRPMPGAPATMPGS